MSYTTSIKNEITSLSLSEAEIIAFLSGFIRNNYTYQANTITLTTENNNTATKIITYLNDLYQVKVNINTIDNLNFTKKELYSLTIKDKTTFILESLGILENNAYLAEPPEYLLEDIEEQKAYLRGVFLSVGSINDPKTSYHMELFINNSKEAVFIQRLLNVFDLNAKILERNKGYMIYLKEAEKISDFLKILGATKAVLYFEEERVLHEKKNETNRLNNCEQANLDKVIETATKELEYINIIEANLGTSLLDDKTLEALTYRKKYPEASLKELSEIISLETNHPITKSGLNHRFRKIKDLAVKFKENS
jgi:DNA-binding protein WhiA